MIISQPATRCLQATWNHLTHRLDHEKQPRDTTSLTPELNESSEHGPPRAPAVAPPTALGDAALIIATGAPTTDPAAPLTAAERRARAAALRAWALSRGRRFDAAEAAFAEAARLDPTLDLTRTPRFWHLERAAHEAAINAYLQVGRERDAAVLRARVQSTFRPKPLRMRHGAALTP